MSFFETYENDPGFQVGQLIRLNQSSWRIVGVRDNGRGVWVTVVPA